MLRKGQIFYERYYVDSSADGIADFKTLCCLDDPNVESRIATSADGDFFFVVKGSVVVDADVATCLAYEFAKDSREATAKRESLGIVQASVKWVNDHSHIVTNVRDLGVKGLPKCCSKTKGIWRARQDGSILAVYKDTNEVADEQVIAASDICVSIQTAAVFESLGNIGEIPQTKVTFVTKFDSTSSVSVPAILLKSLATKFLKAFSSLRKKFDQSLRIDSINRSQIVGNLKLLEPSTLTEDISHHFRRMNGKVRNSNKTHF